MNKYPPWTSQTTAQHDMDTTAAYYQLLQPHLDRPILAAEPRRAHRVAWLC